MLDAPQDTVEYEIMIALRGREFGVADAQVKAGHEMQQLLDLIKRNFHQLEVTFCQAGAGNPPKESDNES